VLSVAVQRLLESAYVDSRPNDGAEAHEKLEAEVVL
jgi:hypothetical protein